MAFEPTVVYVSLVNRSSKDLSGRYDGKQHTLPAGSTTQWPEYIAMKFREQNPVMGSENYYTGEKKYLLGIVEYGDPTEPIEQSASQTKWDMAQVPVPAGAKLETIKGHGFNPYADRQVGLPAQVVGFEPNNDIPGSSKVETVEIAPLPVAPQVFEKP